MTKSIILTGGSTGIGAAASSRLLSKGHQVTIFDVVEPTDSKSHFVQCDMGETSSIENAVASINGPVDTLINVAGISNANPGEKIMRVNFLGLRHLTELLATRLVEGGSIVNVASSAGHDWRNRKDLINELLDSKDFESGLTWVLAHEREWIDNPYKFSKQCTAAYTYRAAGLAVKRRVRVNCVNPGSTGTQLTSDFRQLVGEEMYDWGVAQVGREGTPDDIAEVIEFLAVGDCRWLNGAELPVDGGHVAGLIGGWIDLEESPNAKK